MADWGIKIHQALLTASWSTPAARTLALDRAGSLADAQRQFVLAMDRAKAREASAKADLQQARERFDAESAKVIRFPRSSAWSWPGEDHLSHRVLGKRRGRPRKSEVARQKSEAKANESSAAGRKIDTASMSAPDVARKFDAATPQATLTPDDEGPEIDRGAVQTDSEPPKTDEPPSEMASKSPKSEKIPCTACTEPERIVVAPCKPCTESPVGRASSLLFS